MEIKRLKTSKIFVDSGCFPSRVVLLELKDNTVTPYSTHLEVLPGQDAGIRDYVIWGDYVQTIEDANKSYEFRLKRYNAVNDPGFVPETEFSSI